MNPAARQADRAYLSTGMTGTGTADDLRQVVAGGGMEDGGALLAGELNGSGSA